MNQKVVASIVTVASNADCDACAIWKVIHAAVLRLIERFRAWAIVTANPTGVHREAGGPPATLSGLDLEPEAGLLISRACLALLCCPALGAAVIAAAGVVEMETGDPASTSSFSWSNTSHLRSVWCTASSTLRHLSDSLTLASLMKATTSVHMTFRDHILTTFGAACSAAGNRMCFDTPEPMEDDFPRIFGDHSYCSDGPCLDVILPFTETLLKADSCHSTSEVSADVVAVLRTPSNITLILHETLLDLVNAINRLTVHGLSSPVSTRDFCLRTCDQLLTVYAEVVHLLWPAQDTRQEVETTTETTEQTPGWLAPSNASLQQYAMQLMLDIRFLVRLLVWPLSSSVLGGATAVHDLDVQRLSWQEETIKRLQATSQTLLTRLEAGIDPFDWEMCAEALTTTIVGECIRATRHLYAPLACCTVSVVGSEKAPASDLALTPSATASILPLMSVSADTPTRPSDSRHHGHDHRRRLGDAPGLLPLSLPLSSYLVSRQAPKLHHRQSSELSAGLKLMVDPPMS